MPYLSFDFDLLERLPEMSRAAAVPPGDLALGCLRMWRWCWREKTESIQETHLDGFFGCKGRGWMAVETVNPVSMAQTPCCGLPWRMTATEATCECGKVWRKCEVLP